MGTGLRFWRAGTVVKDQPIAMDCELHFQNARCSREYLHRGCITSGFISADHLARDTELLGKARLTKVRSRARLFELPSELVSPGHKRTTAQLEFGSRGKLVEFCVDQDAYVNYSLHRY